ncbi:hypothetical protein GQ53DRAFT_744716 [Thozetella sp. PMI_491]|nr:hypothetical protein GQ53DRAFT_744716 [Thozetella sp. PMI_491]
MPILVVDGRYNDEDEIIEYLVETCKIPEHQISVSSQRGQFVITVPRKIRDDEVAKLNQHLRQRRRSG